MRILSPLLCLLVVSPVAHADDLQISVDLGYEQMNYAAQDVDVGFERQITLDLGDEGTLMLSPQLVGRSPEGIVVLISTRWDYTSDGASQVQESERTVTLQTGERVALVRGFSHPIQLALTHTKLR